MTLQVTRARDLRQAASLLQDAGSWFLAGGTGVMRAAQGDAGIRQLVLADGLGLDRIEVGGGRIEIGAMVTMAQIASHPALSFLHPVALSIGGPAVRNMATVGGNLFAPYPYGDFAVALLALGAEVLGEDADGSKAVELERFFVGREKMKPTVVRSVKLPLPPTGAFRFAKAVRRKPHGASVLSIAVLLPEARRKVTGARVAYGAMAPTAIRAYGAEAALEGRPLDADAIAAAVAVAAEGCSPQSDPQASAWYRRAVLPVHLQRLLSVF
jgi:CO/xanthine dehydrogenase FAD-binding subunit